MLYAFKGGRISVDGQVVNGVSAIELAAGMAVELINLDDKIEAGFLVPQGGPISEPLVQYGPFLMNTRTEIEQALADYRRTEFGGWPWGASDPVHGREPARFAKHPDGRVERPEAQTAS